jgi:hypothetical protein
MNFSFDFDKEISVYLKNETFVDNLTSSIFINGLFMFLTLPFGVLGFFLNILSFIILFKIEIKNTKLYGYLKVYSILSSFNSLISGLLFTSATPRFLPYIYFSYFSRLIRTIFSIYVLTSIYFITNLLDILIAFERLSIFIRKFQIINKINPYLTSLIITLFVFVFNLPIFFSYYIKSEQEILNDLKTNFSVFAYMGRSPFFYSTLNYYLIIFQILIRDLATLLIEIIFSCLCIHYYRNYLQKSIQFNQNQTNNQSNRSTAVLSKVKKGKRILKMIITMSIISIISHLVVSITYAFAINGYSRAANVAQCYGYLGISFKYFTNFFIFLYFNLNFRKAFLSIFNLSFFSKHDSSSQ